MSGKILVVEDDPDIQELVCYNLRQAGLEAIAVDGGEAAIDRLQVEAVEMVVLDLMLPGMDGLEVCRWLKQQPRLREIPVLMLGEAEIARHRIDERRLWELLRNAGGN